MKDKLNIIFKPFVLALIGLIIGYTLIHWIFFIEFNLFPLKEVITNFGIPITLTGLVAWIFLRPSFKVLNLEVKRGNLRDLYSFIAWLILTAPMLIAQEYIVTATGKLTELNSIKEINVYPSTKYYTLKTYYIDKQNVGIHSTFDVSGKHSEYFNMHIYVAMAIFENENNTSIDKPLGWLGIEYYKQIRNRLEQSEKEIKFREFANKSQNDFDNKNILKFVYLDRIGNTDDRDGYIEAIKKNPIYKPNKTIFVGINELFEARNGKKLQWILGSSLFGLLVWLIMILIPKIDKEQLERIKSGKIDKVAQKEMQEFLNFLKPKEGYFITPILIYINIGIFLLMVFQGLGFFSFKGQVLLNWGANFRPLSTGGQWWRLITSTFLHGGLMHLLANMYGLLFVGIFLEPLLGRTKYLTVYLLAGILASVTSIWWYDATVSVGASGAIFGLYGVFLVLLLTKIYPPDFAKSFLISTTIFIGFNLIMGFAGGVDNAAHIGGLLSGLVIGIILYQILNKQDENKTK